MQRFLLSIALVVFIFHSGLSPLFADTLTNPPAPGVPDQGGAIEFVPGSYIVLPNGETTIIEQTLPNGDLRTKEGLIISPLGILQDGPDKGLSVTLDPGHASANSSVNIQMPAAIPGQTPKVSDGSAPREEVVPKWRQPKKSVEVPEEKAKSEAQKPQNNNKAKQPDKTGKRTPDQLTLAQMLPSTSANQKMPGEARKAPVAEKEAEKPIKKIDKEEKPLKKEPPKKENAKKEPEKKEPPKNQKQPEKPAPKPQKAPAQTPKVKTGEHIRIPPEAIKTGSLDFLEGCWEGTRPEYFSKRIVKECFCFGKGGRTGKRRINDRAGGGRQCIGASQATLSANGVLSVTSQRMACTDGNQWGAARMICRNSGPRTPCSWVFTEAGNGQQSYEIPFIRVESCGR